MAQGRETIKLRIIGTTDVHGAFFPYNFTERKPAAGSMARVSSYVKEQRRIYGDNLILVDNGDILQGQPTNYYTNFIATGEKNIAAEVLNYIGYDVEVFGNHDVETGHAVYDKWIKDLSCPVATANIIDARTGQPYVRPYAVLERAGIKIGILGMLTPAIPNWLHESLWSGLKFEELVSSTRKWVEVLKEKEHCDVIVGVFHSGWEGGIVTSQYDEDATRKVAEQVEGFDVIFFGHDHREKLEFLPNGIVCLNPSCNAMKVAQATIEIQLPDNSPNAKPCCKSSRIVSKQAELIDITGQPVDEDYMQHFAASIEAVRHFIDRKIGSFKKTISSRDAFFGSSAFTDYIHQLQMEHTGADISFTAPFTFDSEIKAGPVYMSDMFKLYRFENQIYMLRMKGSEIRKHLEMSYDLWTNTMTSADDHIMLLNSSSTNDNQRSGFQNFTFNFDSAAGIDYEVDVTKPNGSKVRILKMSNGKPFSEDAWYKVAMNSYRGNGGGELLVRGAGISMDSIPGRIAYMSERDLRYYLTQKIEREGNVNARPLNNWRFVPEAWAKPAIARDRKIIFRD